MSHPNKLPWEGVLTVVDQVSDRSPSGARGHLVVLTSSAARAALSGLEGMAINFKCGWDGHDARQKCGVIESVWLVGQELKVAGYLFCRDFPEIETQLREDGRLAGVMGMSYDLTDVWVEDMLAEVWNLTHCIFTGAAVLLRSRAAYKGTSFRLLKPAELAIAASGVSINGLEESDLA